MEDSERCPMCGSSEWQWAEDPDAYEAMETRCEGCARKDYLREDLDNREGDKPAGTSITLVPRAVARRMRETPKRRPKRRRKREE